MACARCAILCLAWGFCRRVARRSRVSFGMYHPRPGLGSLSLLIHSPGNLRRSTETPFVVRRSARSSVWVVLPDLSRPSTTINAPRAMFSLQSRRSPTRTVRGSPEWRVSLVREGGEARRSSVERLAASASFPQRLQLCNTIVFCS